MNAPANARWLTVLGIGDNGVNSLTPVAMSLLKQAKVLVAPSRVLASLDLDALGLSACEIVPWTMGVKETLTFLQDRRGTPVTILATGDPMHFGIGATMRRSIPEDEMLVVPSPSGFSLAAARLGWGLAGVSCISLHGRSVSAIQPHILPGNRVLSLTSTAKTIFEVADLFQARGFEDSEFTVLDHLGGASERITNHTAKDLATGEFKEGAFADFNMLAVQCVAGPSARILPAVPGLPDDAFAHDGQLTKREVRAATLAALQPVPDGLLWDVGAGCGSVAVEWMRASSGARAIAVENAPDRVALIAQNAIQLGTPTLKVIEGNAPDALADLDAPQAIFIGGGISRDNLFETCWSALEPGGRLVCNVVTVEGENRVSELHATYGGDLTRFAISRAGSVGGFRGFRPLMPVTQWAVLKPWGQP